MTSREFDKITEQNNMNRVLTAISHFEGDDLILIKYILGIISDMDLVDIIKTKTLKTLNKDGEKLQKRIGELYYSPYDEQKSSSDLEDIFSLNLKPVEIEDLTMSSLELRGSLAAIKAKIAVREACNKAEIEINNLRNLINIVG